MIRKTILVVEDEPTILTGLTDLLEGEGYRVVKAADGEEALRKYHAESPNIILLDIMIPESRYGFSVFTFNRRFISGALCFCLFTSFCFFRPRE